MKQGKRYNLLNWLLALALVFAPMQSVMSAIDMLDHGQPQKQHCQMDKVSTAQQDKADEHEGDCCKSGVACVKCISVHAIIAEQVLLSRPTQTLFTQTYKSSAHGIPASSEYRPPRFFS